MKVYKRLGILVILCVLFNWSGGVVADPRGDSETESTETSDTFDYNRTVQLRIGGYRFPRDATFTGPNCVVFRNGEIEEVLAGSVVAHWNERTPLTSKLELVAAGESYLRETAESPIEIPLTDFNAWRGTQMTFSIQLPSPGVGIDQDVSLTMRFSYRGSEDAQFYWGGCVLN